MSLKNTSRLSNTQTHMATAENVYGKKGKDLSMEQTASGLKTTHGIDSDLMFTTADICVLKELGKIVCNYAERPIMI